MEYRNYFLPTKNFLVIRELYGKEAINKYVNLLGVAYSLTILLPFISNNLYKYKFQSLQEVKYHLSECIYKEFIFSKLLKTLQLDKNITTAEDIFKYLANSDKAS